VSIYVYVYLHISPSPSLSLFLLLSFSLSRRKMVLLRSYDVDTAEERRLINRKNLGSIRGGRGGRQTKDCNLILRFPIPPGKAFFRWTWACILLPENWVSWISPNIWRDTVSKCTHRLLKEGNNLKRSLYCACGGSYPQLSGGGSELINKVLMMERLPRQFNIVEHR